MEKSRNINVWICSALGVALLVALIWGFSMQRKAKAYEMSVENQYNRAFHDLCAYIDDIDTLLTKAQLASSPAQLATIASDIFRQSAEAKSALGQLPFSDVELHSTAKFLSQVGDYTYVLSQDMINGVKISDEAYKNLASLNEYSTTLSNNLSGIESKIYSGELKISDFKNAGKMNTAYAAKNSDIFSDLENIEKSFDNYPSLIYDGPFSEHIENRESQMLKNADEITRSEALSAAEKFLNIRGRELEFEGLIENSAIEAFAFDKDDDENEISIGITKKGGYVLYFLNDRDVEEENYDIDFATATAKNFLESHGYYNMESSYFEKENGVATINFAYSDNGVICYSDLIKVKVALDTGEVLGMESKGYLMNHTDREISTEILSEEEARNKISTRLDVTSAGMAIIPKDSMQEVLCYEFRGKFKDKNFLIYVNAQNGREEKIFLLIESPTGILTV